MQTALSYRGYTGILERSEGGLIRGRVVESREILLFEGGTEEEARAEFKNLLDAYLEYCALTLELPRSSPSLVSEPGK